MSGERSASERIGGWFCLFAIVVSDALVLVTHYGSEAHPLNARVVWQLMLGSAGAYSMEAPTRVDHADQRKSHAIVENRDSYFSDSGK